MDDFEMEALTLLARALDPLDRMTCARVLQWAQDRFLEQPRREVEELSWASVEAQMKAYDKYANDMGVDARTLAHALAHTRSIQRLAPVSPDPDPEQTAHTALAPA